MGGNNFQISIPSREAKGSYLRLMGNFNFARFVTALGFSSLGDWMGMVALVALVTRVTGDELAVAAMLLSRFVTALLFGPIAGVLVDRWNRKRVMVLSDLGRGAMVATLPFITTVSSVLRVDQLVIVLAVSAALESLTLLWQSAKDASMPLMVKPHELSHANSLISLAAYGTFPLSGALVGLLVQASKWLGDHVNFFAELRLNQEALAFYFDSLTFVLSAAITATLAIPRRAKKIEKLNARQAWTEFIEGIRFIARHRRVKPWLLGIGMIYAGVGVFLALSTFYVSRVLDAGSAGFGLLVASVGAGLVTGFATAGVAARIVQKDLLFSTSAFALGAVLVAYGSVSTLSAAVPLGVILGFFAGIAYPSAATLVQESVTDDVRGRVVASTHSVIRLALVGGLALGPAMSKIIGDWTWNFLGQEFDLRGARVVMWAGGLSMVGAGFITARAVLARWRGVVAKPWPGLLIAFEGGEGSGKTSQMASLADYLESKGVRVLTTKEPGGTKIGERIREILLDPSTREISTRAEALLYAADRAQHVEQVIIPALKDGAVVLSDRYLDSSLAYQGHARGLGIDSVLGLNRWGTEGLLPDKVFFLDIDPRRGLKRSGGDDRIEQEDVGFHDKVRDAYLSLSSRFPERFTLLDAMLPIDEVQQAIRDEINSMIGAGHTSASAAPIESTPAEQSRL